MQGTFELFDHTADIGVRVRAASLPQLLLAAMQGLYAVIGELRPGRGAMPWTIDIEGDSADQLMRDFLAELLFSFEQEHQIAASLEIEVFNESVLRVHAKMHELDSDASVLHREVKAVTYHELSIEETAGGYEATYIVDI